MTKILPATLALFLIWGSVLAADTPFAQAPEATKKDQGCAISFLLKAKGDVEVAVLNGAGDVIRHLAAGVLGGAKAPPEPLKAGLAQQLHWDGKDDFGKTASGGPFKVRVRSGLGVKFDRFIGDSITNFGNIDGVAADEDGIVYIKGYHGGANQAGTIIRAFDSEGRYLREVVPFPASLNHLAMKDLATWDESRKGFAVQNKANLNPNFLVHGSSGAVEIISASKKTGLLLTDGTNLYNLGLDGSVLRDQLIISSIAPINNWGGGPKFMHASPDGKYMYLSGPFSRSVWGRAFDAKAPPGRIYRFSLESPGAAAEEFVTIPVSHKGDGNGGAWERTVGKNGEGHFTAPHGPVHGLDVDAQGNVYVCDREHDCIAVFDPQGKELGKVSVPTPHQVAVHPQTGAIYVNSWNCIGYHMYSCVAFKLDGYKPGSKVVAQYEFPTGKDINATASMSMVTKGNQTKLWFVGVKGGLVVLNDSGASLQPVSIKYEASGDVPDNFNRLSVDYDRDECYVSNGMNKMWRFEGASGKGGILKKDGREFLANDVAVGYDGLLYMRVSGAWDGSAPEYSGPFWRLDHDLNPAPYASTGSHILSKYIYSRYGIGYAERGIGVGPDGKVYISFMYDWVAYGMGGWDANGVPLKGKYLEGAFPARKAEDRAKYPKDMNSAVVGPLPAAHGCIRVDMKGNIYVGALTLPKGFTPPATFEKDQGYRCSVGSVLKFSPEGGKMMGDEKAVFGDQYEGLTTIYPGLAPFSSQRETLGGNTACVCRVPRFEVDRYGRILMPNSITNSVLVVDNAGNFIAEVGAYGNFDSQFVNRNLSGENMGKPTVGTPEIPLAWPTGVGVSKKAIYFCDTYEKRLVRALPVYASEATCEIK